MAGFAASKLLPFDACIIPHLLPSLLCDLLQEMDARPEDYSVGKHLQCTVKGPDLKTWYECLPPASSKQVSVANRQYCHRQRAG